MVSAEHQVGQPGPANQKIGGIPTVHYFDFFSKGRGQVIRLLFIDAGIAYKDIRYTFDEFPKDIKPKFMNKGGINPTGNVPVIELNGEIMTQSYPIVRHFSRLLGNQYDGDTEDEMFWVDRMCDLTIDWRTKFVDSYFSEKQKENYERHCKENRPVFMDALERHLTENKYAQRGPYVLGTKFTYADMVIYQVLHDEEICSPRQPEMADLKSHPRLAQLADAVRNRPNVKAFLNSAEYKG